MIRLPLLEECNALVQLGIDTGVFNPGEAEELLGQTLRNWFDNNLPFGHQIRVLLEDEILKGWMYFGPTDDSDVWNLWWIGVNPNAIGKGHGKTLLRFVENVVLHNNAKQLIIETSSLPKFQRTRDFYTLQGYSVSEIVSDAYGPGDNKLTYLKTFQV